MEVTGALGLGQKIRFCGCFPELNTRCSALVVLPIFLGSLGTSTDNHALIYLAQKERCQLSFSKSNEMSFEDIVVLKYAEWGLCGGVKIHDTPMQYLRNTWRWRLWALYMHKTFSKYQPYQASIRRPFVPQRAHQALYSTFHTSV